MKTCIVLGSRSEIAIDLTQRLVSDGWDYHGWHRDCQVPLVPWSLVLCAIGAVAPVGLWHEPDVWDWANGVESNVLLPMMLLRRLWKYRNGNATVCFLAGSNPNKVMSGYSAYNAGKMALLKVVEQLDHETPDTKFFALGPGYIPTKIHKPTLEACWPNERISSDKPPSSVEKVYDCLKWCLDQPKEVIGGRNICVSDPYGPELAERLKNNNALFKLRRVE